MRIEYRDEPHGIHMPSQSWFPLVCGIGFLIFGTSMSLFHTVIPFTGFIAVAGLVLVAFAIACWALEGPGGYHLHPEEGEGRTSQPTPETAPSA
jgi:cytochrome c oxidase subunit 1